MSSSRSLLEICLCGSSHTICSIQGLSVELRSYQRQALQFMLDTEKTASGFRDMLFCEVKNSKGESYWYSPVLKRICRHVPAMPQGGFLGMRLCSRFNRLRQEHCSINLIYSDYSIHFCLLSQAAFACQTLLRYTAPACCHVLPYPWKRAIFAHVAAIQLTVCALCWSIAHEHLVHGRDLLLDTCVYASSICVVTHTAVAACCVSSAEGQAAQQQKTVRLQSVTNLKNGTCS